MRGRPKQWNARPATIPTEPTTRDQINQQVGSVRGQVNQAAAPEWPRKWQDRGESERDAGRDQDAVSEAMMECVQIASKIKAHEEIEVSGVGDKDEQDDLERDAAPIRLDAERPFTIEAKDNPKAGESVSNGRSHRRIT
jgi:hypothetical protein